MKILLAFFVLTSFSAFAALQDTLNDLNSNDENVKKALVLEASQGKYLCSGKWPSSSSVDPKFILMPEYNWKSTYLTSNTTPTILVEGKTSGDIKLIYTFYLSQDLMKVNSFKYQEWKVTMGEKNIGTLVEPVFKQSEILVDLGSSTCERTNNN
jgi:hypothetical protein